MPVPVFGLPVPLPFRYTVASTTSSARSVMGRFKYRPVAAVPFVQTGIGLSCLREQLTSSCLAGCGPWGGGREGRRVDGNPHCHLSPRAKHRNAARPPEGGRDDGPLYTCRIEQQAVPVQGIRCCADSPIPRPAIRP